jgi:DNA-directed RNA polymerase sigma subunit (sigma70/sigma32)
MNNILNNTTDVFHAITASKLSSPLREGLTQTEVADILGITRCRVQQIEVEALSKLKKALRKNNIKSLGDVL